MPNTRPKPIQWTLARAATIRRAIIRTEKRLLHDLDPRERADELARLDTLKRVLMLAR